MKYLKINLQIKLTIYKWNENNFDIIYKFRDNKI